METAVAKTANGKAEALTSMPARPLAVKSPDEIMHWLRSNETPLDVVETREGRGGQVFYYLRHQYVTETLNEICGFNWDYRVLRERLDEDQVTVLGELTVRIGEHTIVKSQFGSAAVKRGQDGAPLSIGDDFKAAASDALKKCASLIGLGLDLSLPLQDKTRRHLHAVGKEKFGDKWDQARHRAVRIITKGKHRNKSLPADSANQLLDVEARVLIGVIKGEGSEIVREMAKLLRP